MSVLKQILEKRAMLTCGDCGMRMKSEETNCPDCGVNYGLSMGAKNGLGMAEGAEAADAKSDIDTSKTGMGKKAKAPKIVFSQGEEDSTKKVEEDIDTAEYTIKKYVDQDGETKTRKVRPHRINFKNSRAGAKPSQQDDSTKKVQEDMKTTYKDMITALEEMRSEALQLEDKSNEELELDEKTQPWETDADAAKREKEDKSNFKKPHNPMRSGMDTARALAQKGLKKAKTNEEAEIEEGTGNLKPGWMLKKDPELAKKVKEKLDMAKKRQATYGDKSAGTSVKEELKGNQHKLDKNKNGKLDAEDFKKLRKEEDLDEADGTSRPLTATEKNKLGTMAAMIAKEREDKKARDVKSYADRIASIKDAKRKTNLKEEDMNEEMHPEAGKVLKHIKPEHHSKYTPDLTKKHYTGNYADRTAVLKAAERAGHMKESVFDWKNNPKETKDKTKTSTYHDVKKISTGTTYTKQFDKDGTSKGTGGDAAAKAENAPKRGRGRPKKDKFAESVEILMSLSEEQFDSMMEEGFDSFFEAYEQLDEMSKAALKACGKSTK